MTTFFHRHADHPRLALTPPRPVSPSAPDSSLEQLYRLAQNSRHVFASPLGPFHHAGRRHALPRFVYFGPHSSDHSLRLAVYAGEEARDTAGSAALLHFLERLALTPDLGAGLNISFFPEVDVLGRAPGSASRHLVRSNWSYPDHPEIDLLAKDARVRGYHGFIRLRTDHTVDELTVSLNAGPDATAASSGVELLTSEDFSPWAVRWEGAPARDREPYGPLSLVDDLPVSPFEITVRVPGGWNAGLHREAVARILRSVIIRVRGFDAHAWHI